MKFSLDERADVYTVKAYGPGYVELSAPVYPEGGTDDYPREGFKKEKEEGWQTVHQSIVVLPSRLKEWAPHSFSDLEEAHFQNLLELEPEVVIVGTGESLRFPSPTLAEPLLRQRVGVEFMDTPAACRTYNILVGEGRWVIAALLMI